MTASAIVELVRILGPHPSDPGSSPGAGKISDRFQTDSVRFQTFSERPRVGPFTNKQEQRLPQVEDSMEGVRPRIRPDAHCHPLWVKMMTMRVGPEWVSEN